MALNEISRRVLVTGSEGFIASNLVAELVSRGDTVYTIDRKAGWSHDNRVDHFEGDLNSLDARSFISRARPTHVFHLAAQIDVVQSVKNPIDDAQSNILGTLSLLESLKQIQAVKIVYANSGGAIYSELGEMPYCESSLTFPGAPYGISKLSAETYLLNLFASRSKSVTSLRLSNVYGLNKNDGKIPQGVITKWIEAALSNQEIEVRNLDAGRDFVFVKDVIDAFLLASESEFHGAINIGSGKLVSLSEVLKEIERSLNIVLRRVHTKLNQGEILQNSICICLAAKELQWAPVTSLSSGIAQIICSLPSH